MGNACAAEPCAKARGRCGMPISRMAEGSHLPRPAGASGHFLRVVTVNDVYRMENYPHLAELLRQLKATEQEQGCKVVSMLSGDFLSPCALTALDGGKAMGEVIDLVPLDYVCFGNHEFDVGIDMLQQRTKAFKGFWLNGNIKEPSFHSCDSRPLPAYSVLQVGRRRICISGFTTDEMDLYRPGTQAQIHRPSHAMAKVWQEACEANGELDLFLPMTHQSITADRAGVLEVLGLAPSLRGKMPVICGGHDHGINIEDQEGSLIVKVGADAVNAGIIDVWWEPEGAVRVSCQLLPLHGFEARASCPCKAFVDRQVCLINSMLGAEIMRLPRDMSTEGTRRQPSELASLLLLMVKRALPDVDIALLQGGAVRGRSTYAAGSFKYGDLMRELAFDTEMAIVQLPGSIIAESIRNTRSMPEWENPSYLHADSECFFDSESAWKMTHIGGNPLVEDRMYTVAIYQFLLGGMNEVEPLRSYVNHSVRVPSLERCLPAKQLVMELCMKNAWKKIIGNSTDLDAFFNELDEDHDERISKDELLRKIYAIDSDEDPTNDVPVALVNKLIEVLDTNQDGMLSLSEFRQLAQWTPIAPASF